MEFHQIRYFLATAETLNFTNAAAQCNVSQPALTRAIKKLEHELGGPLFRRERNRTHLTDLGQIVREHLQEIDSTTQNALIAAKKFLNLEKAPLKVGIMCTIGPTRVVPFLSRFQLRHPGIDLTIYDITPHNMTDALLSGTLECALLGLPMKLHDRFDTIKLYDERMVAVFPTDHRFRTLKQVPIIELTGERYLDRLNCEFRNSFFKLLEEMCVKVSVPYRSEREDWIQNMVMNGMGICLMPEFSISVDALRYRPLTKPKLTRNVEMVTVAGHRQSPAVQAFVKEAKLYPWIL
ncbi:LysR family transcriptional regulator [Sneathiella aquimaris]|uniref:LysR family transcriptional regulator n=1 Tax=Sneathiella aquimaris TaxID=2599305 RepID=UPI00146D77FF|nr:LysR family transcriptional regulator [Sneathiella aquimaris]